MTIQDLYNAVDKRKALQKSLDEVVNMLGKLNLTTDSNSHLYITLSNDKYKTEVYVNEKEVKDMLIAKMELLETEIELLDIELLGR